LLAPIEIGWLAVEKVVAGMIQAMVAGLVVIPAAWLIMGRESSSISAGRSSFLLVALLVALFSSAGGLALGCSVGQTQIGLMFSLVLAPMDDVRLRLLPVERAGRRSRFCTWRCSSTAGVRQRGLRGRWFPRCRI